MTKHISAARLDHFFIADSDHYRVKPFLRKMVIFAQHDLVKNPPYCNMQFISCRNLLIYVTPVLQKKIYLMLLFGLKVHGYLFLGSSENPSPIIENLEVLQKRLKIYRNIETKRTARFDVFSLPDMMDIKKRVPDFISTDTANKNNGLDEDINVTLVKSMDALLICVDDNNQVIKTYGDTSRFLLQKNFNLNLVELLPRSLGIAFNGVKNSSIKSGHREMVRGIAIESGPEIKLVCVAVERMDTSRSEADLWIVTFTEDKSPIDPAINAKAFDERVFLDEIYPQYGGGVETGTGKITCCVY